MTDVKKEVESLLFSSGKAMSEKDLADLIGAKPLEVKKAIEALRQDYEQRDTSLAIMDTGEGYKLNVKEKYVNLVTKIVADTELPFPVLETLSVIAFKAPAWQAEVIHARGTNAYEHIQILIDGGFIERRKKGRSFELGLTQKFFDYFDVEGEKSLKMILKDVKPSEPKRNKLGSLDVVELPDAGQQAAKAAGDSNPAGKEPMLGELSIVVIPEHGRREQFKPDTEFLSSVDERIMEASKRNDDLDQDEFFSKSPLSDAQAAVSEDYEFEPMENKKTKDIFSKHSNDEAYSASGPGLSKESMKGYDEQSEESAAKDPLDDDDDKVDL